MDASYHYCERLAHAHYENFPVGSFLVPKRLRKHFYAIYAFARTADDFADEACFGEAGVAGRQAYLADWGEMLADCYVGTARHPIFVAVADTASRFDLPIELFRDLLSAFTQDITTRRYETYAALLDYCRRSANPVGRLILRLFGFKDAVMFRQSDAICTALQLTNHWQDIASDLRRDRVYLPAEDLARFGLTVEQLKTQKCTTAFRELMAYETERVRRLFIDGKPLCASVGGRLGLELRAVWTAEA